MKDKIQVQVDYRKLEAVQRILGTIGKTRPTIVKVNTSVTTKVIGREEVRKWAQTRG